MKERAFGVKYLPAGNKLGKIGAPEIKDEDLEQILRHVCRRSSGRRPAITIEHYLEKYNINRRRRRSH
jgi:hypothetical protein